MSGPGPGMPTPNDPQPPPPPRPGPPAVTDPALLEALDEWRRETEAIFASYGYEVVR